MHYEIRFRSPSGKEHWVCVKATNVSEAVSIISDCVPSIRANVNLIKSCIRITYD